MIKGLHHNAYRCRDSEETRAFYEDFLGLRMVSAFEMNEDRALRTFFEMDNGSCLTFFEMPGSPFDLRHARQPKSPTPATHSSQQFRPRAAKSRRTSP